MKWWWGQGRGLCCSGAHYEGLWSKPVLDQRFSAKHGPLLSLNNKKLKLIMPSGARQRKGNWKLSPVNGGETQWETEACTLPVLVPAFCADDGFMMS